MAVVCFMQPCGRPIVITRIPPRAIDIVKELGPREAKRVHGRVAQAIDDARSTGA